jgi:hypothetical protein
MRTRVTDSAFACVCLEVHTIPEPETRYLTQKIFQLQAGAPPFAELPDVPAMLKIIAGQRPARPENMSDRIWVVVNAAWAGDFRQRPDTSRIIIFTGKMS